MSEAKVNSNDIEVVFQRLRALPCNKVNIPTSNLVFIYGSEFYKNIITYL